MRSMPLLAATLMLAAATPAAAKDKAEGWAKWTAQAELIAAAMADADNFKSRIKTACSGVTGTVIGQGFQFPYWAQGLIQVCTVLKEDWIYRDGNAQCKDVKRVVKVLDKAEPVPEGPGAAEVAKRIAGMLQSAYDAKCK
jgi:hypothetical protein